MIETDSLNHPVVVDDLDADLLLSLCEEAETQTRIADRRRIRYALRWAELHPAPADQAAKGYVETVGGPGTPDVEELSTEPLGAAFGITTHAALQLVSDALDLAHRLPRIWARVQALEVTVWRARRIAQATHALTVEQAAVVDAALVAKAGTCGVVTIDNAVAEAIAADAPDELADDEDAARATWGVRLFHPPVTGPARWAATSVLQITGDTTVLSDLYDRLTAIATELGHAGDTDPIEIRRAKAVAQLTHGAGDNPPRTRLYLHADYSQLADDTVGTGSVERLGPVTMARIRDWLGRRSVTVVPVIRTDRTDAVDRHDPPQWMRELVILRDGHCVFPHCQTGARSCDLDHIEEYVDPDDGGPPGQTRPGNLAPLCRRHHRAKTRRRWRYRRSPDGSYTWTGPHDRQYVVDKSGTLAIPD